MDDEFVVGPNEKFRLRLRSDGIVQLAWANGLPIGLEHAVAVLAAVTHLTHGHRAPLLVDARRVGAQDRGARLEFARRSDAVSAVALIVGTPLSRIGADFFLTVSKPATPTRLFDDEASALVWLAGFTE